jgi:hypothetical protein
MSSEAGFGTAAVRYASVGTGFRGPSGPPTVAEPATDGRGPAHGRGRTSPRTGAEKATDGAGGSGHADRSHPDSHPDLPFQDACSCSHSSARPWFTASSPSGSRAALNPPGMSLLGHQQLRSSSRFPGSCSCGLSATAGSRSSHAGPDPGSPQARHSRRKRGAGTCLLPSQDRLATPVNGRGSRGRIPGFREVA